jgi:4'-phosphopantetheinyl transferase
MIHIYYSVCTEPLSERAYIYYLNQLPGPLQEKNVKYRRWQDKHLHLFGKMQLLAGLKNMGYTDNILNKINYNDYSRPYLNKDIDFNISHSGEYVLCAIGKNLRLGIDVEEIKQINFDDFEQVMTHRQWLDIMQSEDPERFFFKYWTIKESVIKADSRGLSIPLLDIHVNDNKVCYDNKTWYLKEFNLDERYSICLATDIENALFKMELIDFYNPKEGINGL